MSRRLSSNTQCTSLAIYSLEKPPTIHTGLAGRPKLDVSENVILASFTWFLSGKTSPICCSFHDGL